MPQNWEKGSIYEFSVMFLTRDSRDKEYYCLRNAEDPTDNNYYRVYIYEFQSEWKTTPSKIRCRVTDVVDGFPKLAQLRLDLLKDVYPVLPAIYTMTIEGIELDSATNANYFKLRDSANLSHRYYFSNDGIPKDKYKIGEKIELYVENIAGSEVKANLKLTELASRRDQSVQFSKKQISSFTKEERDESHYLPQDEYESSTVEWKSSLIYPAGQSSEDMDKQLSVITRTVCGFLNKDGGEILIGVTDQRRIVGIENELDKLYSKSLERRYTNSLDGYELAIRDALKEKIGSNYDISQCITITFETLEQKYTVCRISVKPAKYPVYFNQTTIYVRSGNMTTHLKGGDITRFILDRTQSQKLDILEDKEPTIQNISEKEEEEEVELTEIYTSSEHENRQISSTPIEMLLPSRPRSKTSREAYARIKCVLIFYKDGSTHFRNDYVPHGSSILWQQEVPQRIANASSIKRYSLMICYKSGKVNRVPLSSIELNKTRKTVNGWSKDDEIFNIFIAEDNDKIAVYSKVEGTWYTKLHKLSAISKHERNLQLKGNLCTLSNNEECRIYHVLSQNPEIDDLVLRDCYTSQKAGIQMATEYNYDYHTQKILKDSCDNIITPI